MTPSKPQLQCRAIKALLDEVSVCDYGRNVLQTDTMFQNKTHRYVCVAPPLCSVPVQVLFIQGVFTMVTSAVYRRC